MTEALENLARIGELHREAPDRSEIDGLIAAAEMRLRDARTESLSSGSRFLLAYGAAHALALAALRRHGYRSNKRYLVFQCLTHTLGYEAAECRIFDECHRRRNLAEYEGRFEVEEALENELLDMTAEMLDRVRALERNNNV